MDHAYRLGLARSSRTLRALANGGQSLSTLAQRGTMGSYPAGLATTRGSCPFLCLSSLSVAVVLKLVSILKRWFCYSKTPVKRSGADHGADTPSLLSAMWCAHSHKITKLCNLWSNGRSNAVQQYAYRSSTRLSVRTTAIVTCRPASFTRQCTCTAGLSTGFNASIPNRSGRLPTLYITVISGAS